MRRSLTAGSSVLFLLLLTILQVTTAMAAELPQCEPGTPGVADSLLLNPPKPNEFATIQFIGPTAQSTFEAMTDIPIVENQMGSDQFFDKDGKNIECSKWVLKKSCVEYHCSVNFDNIKTGTAHNEQ